METSTRVPEVRHHAADKTLTPVAAGRGIMRSSVDVHQCLCSV